MTIPTFPSNLKGLAYPVKRSPTMSSIRNQAISGRQGFLPLWPYPLYKYQLSFSVLWQDRGNDWATLEGFWKSVMAAPGGVFQFNDPNDGAATDQSFGEGDGTTTQFQLVRTLGGFAEPVLAPVGTPTVADAGTPTAAFTLGSYGVITFSAAPLAGHALTWSGNYNWLCQFDNDQLDLENFAYHYWALRQLSFTTWRP